MTPYGPSLIGEVRSFSLGSRNNEVESDIAVATPDFWSTTIKDDAKWPKNRRQSLHSLLGGRVKGIQCILRIDCSDFRLAAA